MQCGMMESCNSIFAGNCTQLLNNSYCAVLSQTVESECAFLYDSNDTESFPWAIACAGSLRLFHFGICY